MQIGFILFPNVTQLDFTGPLQVLHRMPGATTSIIAKTADPVPSDCGLGLMPTHTFDTAPKLDFICVPGGFGVVDALGDTETMDFVRQMGEGADYVTSVCTGALILGGAGLLKGKKATTHWAYTDLLSVFGATYTKGRVVRDGNTFTGGGVTAGIDFAYTIIADLVDQKTAEALQLGLEYNPQPPTGTGHPDVAPEKLTAAMRKHYVEQVANTRAALEALTA
ncbi:MAG: DJ-1/PfpI family protein [Pseudomonadota bacterium]